MKTARPPQCEGEPLVLLESAIHERRRGAWVASLLLHIAVVLALVLTPAGLMQSPARVPEVRNFTVLVAPPPDSRPAAPGREFTLEDLVARPPLRVPAAVPPMSSGAPARPLIPAPAPAPRQVIETPRVEAASRLPSQSPPADVPLSQTPAPPPPPQPEIQPAEKPKLAFETPGRPSRDPQVSGVAPGTVAVPGSTVTEAVRAAIRGGAGATVIGDFDLPGSSGIGGGLNLPGSPQRSSTSLELLSDPMGVDFKPYLVQLLAAVRRNWRTVIPESARLGRQGRVQIQFAIARDGTVPKLVISLPSGTDAFDRAAVAGISMTAAQGFPAFPAAFTGKELRLQLTFLYNLRQ